MSVDVEAWVRDWHEVVKSRDLSNVEDLLAEDMTLGAPPHWKKLETKRVCGMLFRVIIEVIPDFAYHRQWINGREIVLEFTGHVGNLGLQGVDIITLNEEGKVQNLDVMLRPANALMELMSLVGEKMAAKLAESA